MHKTVDLFTEPVVHRDAVKGTVVIPCHDETALCLAAPVAPCSDNAEVWICIGKIGIDAGDIAVAFGIGE